MEINLSVWMPIVQAIVTVAALVIASYVGLAGLDAWKYQLRFKEEHDLARRLLLSVYKLRAAMGFARLNESLVRGMDKTAKARTYEIELPRIQDMEQARRELKLGMQEAEAVWGFTVRYELEQLSILAGRIRFAYDVYDWFGPGGPPESDDQVAPLFHGSWGEEDKFWTEVEYAMIAIQKILRPKLIVGQPENWWKRQWKRWRRWLKRRERVNS